MAAIERPTWANQFPEKLESGDQPIEKWSEDGNSVLVYVESKDHEDRPVISISLNAVVWTGDIEDGTTERYEELRIPLFEVNQTVSADGQLKTSLYIDAIKTRGSEGQPQIPPLGCYSYDEQGNFRHSRMSTGNSYVEEIADKLFTESELPPNIDLQATVDAFLGQMAWVDSEHNDIAFQKPLLIPVASQTPVPPVL